MKKLIIFIFGNKWRYGFSVSDSSNRRVLIRVNRFGQVQVYKTFGSEAWWVDIVMYTKKGATTSPGYGE